MRNQASPTDRETLTLMVSETAELLSRRAGETDQCRIQRYRSVVDMVMAFVPATPVEAMLAGHCVTFHEMMVDGGGDMFRSTNGSARAAARREIVALDKVFGRNLAALERRQ